LQITSILVGGAEQAQGRPRRRPSRVPVHESVSGPLKDDESRIVPLLDARLPLRQHQDRRGYWQLMADGQPRPDLVCFSAGGAVASPATDPFALKQP
jgi:hypothetical protein